MTDNTSAYPGASTLGFSSQRRGDGAGANTCCLAMQAVTYFRLRTCNNSSAQSTIDTDVNTSTRFVPHFWKVESTGTLASLSENGVFKCSSTTNLPTGGMAPAFGIQNSNSGHPVTMNISYCEAWNT